MHLFVDISSHGFGHLAITAPVLNALAEICPTLRLTVRTRLPASLLRERIRPAFSLIAQSSDFGYRMHDATRVDLPASAADYRSAHEDWPDKVAAEARFLAELAPDRILSCVSYLPLAAAARLGIPALALCSLNWADLFAHYFSHEDWAAPIHAQMLAAYRSATTFLRITPGMPMPALDNRCDIGPIGALGRRHSLGNADQRYILLAMGGIAHRLPVENWPHHPGICWLTPADWQCQHPSSRAATAFGLSFTDLLCSVDAVITKPGYGTFTEAAANGIPVLYQRREDWPEQDCLIDWLEENTRSREITVDRLQSGDLLTDLNALWSQAAPPRPQLSGIEAAARLIAGEIQSA